MSGSVKLIRPRGVRVVGGMGLENPLHLAILVLVVVLLFGARRLPELGKSLGAGMREFKGSISGDNAPSATPGLPPAAATAPVVAQAAPATRDA